MSYASRGLSEAEKRYAQIEKEALVLTWVCEKILKLYPRCRNRVANIAHKPLVNILGMKLISELSARLQRFRMRLVRFTYNIKHVPRRELYTADTLSRAPQKYDHNEADILFEKNMDLYVRAVEAATPIKDTLLQEIRETQGKDSIGHT